MWRQSVRLCSAPRLSRRGVIRADTNDKDSGYWESLSGAVPGTAGFHFNPVWRWDSVGKAVCICDLVVLFFAAFFSSRVSICFALLHKQVYTFSSQRVCGFLLGLLGTPRPPTASWLCSMFSLLPPEWGGVRSCVGELVFWCPDVVSAGFPSLWTRSREHACRVEAYNLPDLLLIYSLKRWGQSMFILTLVINTLLLPPYTNLYLAINVTGVILSFIAWCHWSNTLVLFSF